MLSFEDKPKTYYPFARVEYLTDADYERTEQSHKEVKLFQEAMARLQETMTDSEHKMFEQISRQFDMRHLTQLVDYSGVVMSYLVSTDKIQAAFEAESLMSRMKLMRELAEDSVALRTSIKSQQTEEKEKPSQEEVYKGIISIVSKKLGMDKDDKELLKLKFLKSLEGKQVPRQIQALIDEELGRLMATDMASGEFYIIRTYLDWLTAMPYGLCTQETLDLQKAKEVLDKDHYGMKAVKDRILEFIAISKLRGSSTGKILCFTGPPGVGKTSIAKAIAEALNRKFTRISLGGLNDVAEFKGHRRTYIGAQPGKLVKALRQAGTENPVILLDEIDKLGRNSHRGSPEHSLLEVLDPSQNSCFTDYYLDVPIDLSKVLFVCTANHLHKLSRVLLDRLEVIEVEGYSAEEKAHILDTFLLPKAIKELALQSHAEQFTVSEAAKQALVHNYCREAGVRGLQRITERICEKIAVRIVKGETAAVDAGNLTDFAGHPPYPSERFYAEMPPGVVMGLSYSEQGGSVLYLEVSKSSYGDEKTPGVKATGRLMKVMSESIQVAYSYAKRLASSKQNSFLDLNSIHIHAPEGAVSKDGPSAGVTITTAILSLAFNTPVLAYLAMTGEISLNGRVLPIGGLKEKLVAAKREGVKTVVLPEANRHNWEELSVSLREGFTAVFVSEYHEVFAVAFPGLGVLG